MQKKGIKIKYRILAHYNTNDCYLVDDEFDDVDKAVRHAIELTGRTDFLIVKVIDWEVKIKSCKK